MLSRLLYQFPVWMQRLYRGVTWRKADDRKVVCLTFDDGPIPQVTPLILNILREKNVHATFFLVGENVERYPELYRHILADGHRVGNHTYHHLKGFRTSCRGYLSDVEHCNAVLGDGIGATPLLRPPYGRIRTSQKIALIRSGYRAHRWHGMDGQCGDARSGFGLVQARTVPGPSSSSTTA